MFWAIDHCGKTPSDCRSPATSATGALTSAPARRRAAASKVGEQQIGLAVAGETREADDLARMRDQFLAVALTLGADAHPAPAPRRALRPRRGFSPGASGSTPPIAPISRARSNVSRGVGHDDLAVAHDDDAVAVADSTSPRMCEISDAAHARATARRT